MQTSYLQSRGDTHSQKSQSAQMQRCSTFNQALYSLLHLYIGDLEQSRKGNESNSTGIFQPDFYDRGAEESNFYKFL